MLAAVILTKNSGRKVNSTLSSLVESSCIPREVVIFDGGSKDNTLEIVKKFYDKLNIKVVY
ncbi:MAG: glycosyltransferase, partial [Fervidicoccus fontis]